MEERQQPSHGRDTWKSQASISPPDSRPQSALGNIDISALGSSCRSSSNFDRNEPDTEARLPLDEGDCGKQPPPGWLGHVRHYFLGVFLLTFYALVGIFSWTVTCVLWRSPVGVPSWYGQATAYPESNYHTTEGLRRAANIGLFVMAATGIPVTSAIAARAAVVYCEGSLRRRGGH